MSNEKGRGGSLGTKTGNAAGRATGGTKTGSSAGGRHGSNARSDQAQSPSGLQESSGEFRIGEGIIFGMRNGNILIRHSPQGDEVEVGEGTLAGLMVDAFFDKTLGDAYPTVNKQG